MLRDGRLDHASVWGIKNTERKEDDMQLTLIAFTV